MGLEGFALRAEIFGLYLGIVIRSMQYGNFWGHGSATRDIPDIPICCTVSPFAWATSWMTVLYMV